MEADSEPIRTAKSSQEFKNKSRSATTKTKWTRFGGKRAARKQKKTNKVENKNKEANNSDFPTMLGDMVKMTPFKILIWLFLVIIIVFSDTFTKSILARIPGTVDMGISNTKGTLISALIVCIIMWIIYLLTQGDLL